MSLLLRRRILTHLRLGFHAYVILIQEELLLDGFIDPQLLEGVTDEFILELLIELLIDVLLLQFEVPEYIYVF